MRSDIKPTIGKIGREILITLCASLVLIIIAYIFIGKVRQVEALENRSYLQQVHKLWADLDANIVTSHMLRDIEPHDVMFDIEKSRIDQLKTEAVDNLQREEAVNIIFKLKMLHWNNLPMKADLIDSDERTLDTSDVTYVIRSLDNEDKAVYKMIKPFSFETESVSSGTAPQPTYPIDPDSIRTEYYYQRYKVEEIITAYLKDHPLESGSLASTGSTVGWKDYLEMLIFISLSVFILTSVVTLASRFIARLIAASFIQDMIRGTAIRSRIKTDLLPYFFSIPAFIWGTILAPSSLMQSEQVKFLAILLIIIVAGGLSFELILKYQEQSKLEYNKAYARYLSRYKRKREYLGLMQLIKMIFIPSRNHTLKHSQSVLPFILTGADYQLTDYTKRRMTIVVDAYALAGIVFSFTIWDNWGKPDLVLMLTETAGKYGFSLNVIVLIEAILVGILASKILMILSEHRQFPGER